MSTATPTAAGVAAASRLLRSRVVRTPLLECPLLNSLLPNGSGGRLLLKAECLQTTGSFKFRGALHRLLRLREDDPPAAERGVVAFSSGNFGQALAAAAKSLGIKCSVVSPHDAPSVKLERIKGYGARLVLSEAEEGVNREVAASGLAVSLSEDEGLTLLHHFEDVEVVHGQGTAGVELLEQAEEVLSRGANGDNACKLRTIVVPCGGGGLTAGINLAVERAGLSSDVGVMSVEPAGYDDHAKSFSHPERTRRSLAELYPASEPPPENKSHYCDALMAGAPGKTTWKVNAPRLEGALSSPGDESAARAMRVAFDHFRLVLEPSGALALAAVLDGEVEVREGEAVAVVASGGNTDMATFARLMGCTSQIGSV